MGAHDWIGNLVQNGTIDPIQIPESVSSTLQPLAIDAVTFDGQTYGMPYTMNNIVLFRNTDLAPEAPATMEDMVAAGQKAVQSGDAEEPLAWPVSDTGNPYFINPLYTSGGGYMFGQTDDGSFDPSDLGVGTPGSIEAYTKIGALGEKGEGVLKRSVNTDNAIALFTAGKTPFLIEGPWQLTTLDDSKVNYEVSPVPGFKGMDPASPFITVDAAYVASGGANKTLAQEFVTNYWSRADVGATLFEATKNVPANVDTLSQIEGDNPAVAAVAAAGAENGQIMPSIPRDGGGLGPAGQGRGSRDRRRRPGVDHQVGPEGHRVGHQGVASVLRGGPRPAPEPVDPTRTRRGESRGTQHHTPPGRKAPRFGLGADGTSSPWMLLIKIGGLALVTAVAVWAAVPLIDAENWLGLAILVAVTVLAFYVYLSPRAVPMKYLLPGTLFLIAFQIVPVVYTVSTAFTNFGDGHRGTKEEAITAIEGASVKQVPDSEIYTLTLATDGDAATGDIVFLLAEPASGDSFVGTADGLEPLEEGTFEAATPGGKITEADGYTVLTVPQVNARQDEITMFSVPTEDGSDQEPGALHGLRGRAAAVVRRGVRLHHRRDDRQRVDRRRRGRLVRQRGRLAGSRRAGRSTSGSRTSPGCSPTTPSASRSCASWCGTSRSPSAPWSSRSRWACSWPSRSTTR